jgi:hypothetical protein
MQKPGWNPARRNRNIGTARQGHGQDNRLVIPGNWRDSRSFWQRVSSFTVVTRPVHNRELLFVIEPTRTDSVHACTVDDIARLLNLAPRNHVSGIQGVILRQPKRKEEVISPAWGRLGYAVEVGPISGAAIVLEAFRLPFTLKWPTRLDPPRQQELDRLLLEADRVESNGRHHVLHFGLSAVRRVQLYRTLLHELGHWVDCYEKVEIPSRIEGGATWSELWEAYCRRPVSERESFAHRYACELAQDLMRRRRIPFERMLNEKKLALEGVSRADFISDADP